MTLPNYAWPELKEHINFVLEVFAEPPYSILLCEELLTKPLNELQPGTNVFIINVPFFLDCPSHKKDQALFIQLFRDQFPYLAFCMIDGQYLVADLEIAYEDVFK